MTLAAGSKLGPYEIGAPLGAGGMGEVYRAHDTRLDRDVAIKVLPGNLSSNAALRQRLEREAKAISRLSHPNICTLYDIGHQDGVDYLVMELIEGETLEQRLIKGSLPPDQTIRCASQIADALVKAHKQGIVHRDLKPANIMLTKTGAKLMDFGLAKQAKPPALGDAVTEMTMAGTKLTGEGSIVGTFQYMAPEQLEGKDADVRTDIFALGEVIYEMATGKPAFTGKSRASLIAAILTTDPPPITQLQPMSPAALDRVVRTCLAKDPDDRFQSAHDLKLQLDWTGELASGSGVQPVAVAPATSYRRIWGIAAVAAAIALAAGFWASSMWRTPTTQTVQFEINAPEKTVFNFRGLSGPPVTSPDGKKMAFVSNYQGQAGGRALWLRSLDSTESKLLPGTEGASYPFWSPDSRFIGFFASGKLKKFDVAGSSAITLCDVAEGRGGAWSKDGVILFGNRADTIFRVDAAGGKPVRLTAFDEKLQEVSHRWPQFLPDQKHFLFVSQSYQASSAHLMVASLDSPQGRVLEGMPHILSLGSGTVVYVLDNTLFVRSFDTDSLKFTSEPTVVAEHVQNDLQFNNAALSVSGSVLAYQTGAVQAGTQLVVLDRTGKQTLLSQETGLLQYMSLSPRGDLLALSIGLNSGQLSDIWLYDLQKNQKAKLTFDQHSGDAIWSPDGKQIAFYRVTPDGFEIVVRDVLGAGAERVLCKESRQVFPEAFSPDARYLFYRVGPGSSEIKVVATSGEHQAYKLFETRTGWAEASLSPDGKWLAYVSDESGHSAVYVVPIHFGPQGPTVGSGKWQVADNATAPLWNPDGKQLLFASSSVTGMFVSQITTVGDHFANDPPKYLFDLGAHPIGKFYAISRDGQKIYMSTYGPGSSAPITVTLNWQSLLKK